MNSDNWAPLHLAARRGNCQDCQADLSPIWSGLRTGATLCELCNQTKSQLTLSRTVLASARTANNQKRNLVKRNVDY